MEGKPGWEPDQPNDGPWANCAVMHYGQGGKWNDRNCEDEQAVMCRVVAP